jgi:hypothetical protein
MRLEGEGENRDELFTASGVTQAIHVDTVAQSTAATRKISLAPRPDQPFAIETSSPLTAISPPESQVDQLLDEIPCCVLQQRIAKVKRHSADISKQLDKLGSLSDLPTDKGPE